MHYDSDGQTLDTVLRFPSEVQDVSIDRTNSRIAAIGAFGLVYLNTDDHSVVWSKTLNPDSNPHPDNYIEGTHVDIGTNGTIAALYGKRVSVYNPQGVSLSNQPNDSLD